MRVGSTIKLNPKMFETGGTFSKKDHYGQLGYPGLLRDWKFKIIEIFDHGYHGKMARVQSLNQAGVELVLRVADSVIAFNKITVDYTVVPTKFDDLNQELENLRKERVAMKQRGLAMNNVNMRNNWAKQKAMRAKITAVQQEDAVSVYVPKIKQTFKMDRKVGADDFNQVLIDKIAQYRASLKTRTAKNAGAIVEKNVMGTRVVLEGGVHMTPYVYGKINEAMLATFIDKAKVPTKADANYIGIELELIHLCSRPELKKKFIEARLHKHVNLTTDGSIHVDVEGCTGTEVRVLVTEDELESVMARIQEVLKDRTVDAYVNRSCGTHVHIDMRNRKVDLCYNNLFRVQKLLRYSQPAHRLTSRYCRENKENKFKTVERNDEARYSVINTNAYQKLQSLEVRVHEGTVDCVKFVNWCKFLMSVVNHKDEIKVNIETADQLRKAIPEVDLSGLEYVASRMTYYAHA